jgi:acyl-CoA thioesterase-1
MSLMNMPLLREKFKSHFRHHDQTARWCWLLGCLILICLTTSCQRSTGGAASVAESLSRGEGDVSASPSLDLTGRPRIVALGNSLTAGYGLEISHSYPALLQKRLDEKGYRYEVVNAGISGDTSAGGLARLEWVLQGNVRFLILELGANDGLRGLPVVEMKKNLAQIIEHAQKKNVTVILAGMEAPPNYGENYTREFRQAFRDLARQYNVKLIPFFLQGVAGLASLNQADGIHPNVEGTRMVMENVWRVLEPLLEQPGG